MKKGFVKQQLQLDNVGGRLSEPPLTKSQIRPSLLRNKIYDLVRNRIFSNRSRRKYVDSTESFMCKLLLTFNLRLQPLQHFAASEFPFSPQIRQCKIVSQFPIPLPYNIKSYLPKSQRNFQKLTTNLNYTARIILSQTYN